MGARFCPKCGTRLSDTQRKTSERRMDAARSTKSGLGTPNPIRKQSFTAPAFDAMVRGTLDRLLKEQPAATAFHVREGERLLSIIALTSTGDSERTQAISDLLTWHQEALDLLLITGRRKGEDDQ
jgi:hypothetical protein